jgi:hypothetical protein
MWIAVLCASWPCLVAHFEPHCFATREACEMAAEEAQSSSRKYSASAYCRYVDGDDDRVGDAIRRRMREDYRPASKPVRISD